MSQWTKTEMPTGATERGAGGGRAGSGPPRDCTCSRLVLAVRVRFPGPCQAKDAGRYERRTPSKSKMRAGAFERPRIHPRRRWDGRYTGPARFPREGGRVRREGGRRQAGGARLRDRPARTQGLVYDIILGHVLAARPCGQRSRAVSAAGPPHRALGAASRAGQRRCGTWVELVRVGGALRLQRHPPPPRRVQLVRKEGRDVSG
jgi:hypothetical protein